MHMAEVTGPRFPVSVAAVVVDNERRVLAVQRRDGQYKGRWELPGGRLEPDETLYEGVVREVLEETGLTVEPGALTGVYQNIVRGTVALVFRCHIVAGEPRPSEETSKVEWLTPTEVRKWMTESYAIRLLDGLKDGRPAIRVHDGTSLLPANIRRN